jgi:polyisoprenoid-binding protein YceI
MRFSPLTPALTAAFAFCAVAAAPALGQEIVLELDPARTTVEFKLDATLHTVHGAFKLKRGAIRFDPATKKIAGEVVVDATTGDSGNEGRDHKMHQNVLESQRYPEIVFTPDRVEGTVAPQVASQVQVHGSFRIHGATQDITLPVRIQMTDGQATATTHFTIPYVKWGLKNPSTLFLHVGDKVEIDATAYTR